LLRYICQIYAHTRKKWPPWHDGCEGWHGNGSCLCSTLLRVDERGKTCRLVIVWVWAWPFVRSIRDGKRKTEKGYTHIWNQRFLGTHYVSVSRPSPRLPLSSTIKTTLKRTSWCINLMVFKSLNSWMENKYNFFNVKNQLYLCVCVVSG